MLNISASTELGARRPAASLPFSPEMVGTYSCRGSRSDPLGPTAPPKVNQDRGCVCFPLGDGALRQALFCVFDGHGPAGHDVSSYAATSLPAALHAHADLNADPARALREVIMQTDEALRLDPAIDTSHSGTTAVICLVRAEPDGTDRIYAANVGDSRAVLGWHQRRCTGWIRTESGIGAMGSASHMRPRTHPQPPRPNHPQRPPPTLLAFDRRRLMKKVIKPLPLTEDQKAGMAAERARIEQSGGFVSESSDDGPARVWHDAAMVPPGGLAVSRSIGDHSMRGIGVIADPVVTSHRWTDPHPYPDRSTPPGIPVVRLTAIPAHPCESSLHRSAQSDGPHWA